MFCSNWVVPVGRMGVSSPSARVWAPRLCPVLGTIILNLAWARWRRKKSAKLMACSLNLKRLGITYITLRFWWRHPNLEFHLQFHGVRISSCIVASPCKSQPVTVRCDRSRFLRPYISCIAPLPRMPSVVPPDSKFQVVFQMAIPLAHQIRTHQIKLCLILYSRIFLVVQHDFLSWISNESWDSLQARNPMRGFRKDITWPLPMHLRLPAEGVVPPSGAVQHGESHHVTFQVVW